MIATSFSLFAEVDAPGLVWPDCPGCVGCPGCGLLWPCADRVPSANPHVSVIAAAAVVVSFITFVLVLTVDAKVASTAIGLQGMCPATTSGEAGKGDGSPCYGTREGKHGQAEG